MTVPAPHDIYAARHRLASRLPVTPLRRSAWLSDAVQGEVRLKLESLNLTHSFKIRGAFNALLTLPGAADSRSSAASAQPGGVVTASAGNHGQALAFAAGALRIPCVVFTPADAPHTKTSAIRRYGATLNTDAADYDTAERMARAYAAATGAPFVSPYNDAAVIAGAGTIGLEIVEADPAVDTIVVPLGGGGLASGVGLAVRAAAPRARIIGVEVEASTPFTVGLSEGRITHIDPAPTLADGLAGNLEAGSITFPIVQRVVDEVVTVSEGDLIRAMRGLAAEEHLIVEGAAATVIAALMAGKIAAARRRVTAIVTGANIDERRLLSVLVP